MIDLCFVHYNTQALLQRALKALFLPSGQPKGFRVLVADNGSVDDTPAWLTHSGAQWGVDTYRINANIGYARACNQLAALGTAEVIGLLNADVWMTPSQVELIDATFASNPEIAVLGPKQRDENGVIRHAGIFGTWDAPIIRGWDIQDAQDTSYRTREECLGISGSAYFIRREVWSELSLCPHFRAQYPDVEGAFLPTPHYFEETWCSHHARLHGRRIFYDGAISIGHSWHASHPYGGTTDALYARSERMFRQACAFHP